MSRQVLLTGATGFIGSALLPSLRVAGANVHIAGRNVVTEKDVAVQSFRRMDLQESEAIASMDLHGLHTVCHLAAHVHVMNSSKEDHLLFDRMNTQATVALAQACIRGGVRRLVFLSSIKVNGELTKGYAFRADDTPSPHDAYGRSKWNAEQALGRIASESGLEVVIVRPPLVYGPGVGANFRKLIALVNSGWPLPLGAVDNRRSLVSVWNLVGFLREAILGDSVEPGTWLVSDGQDISTRTLVSYLAAGLGKGARMYPVPPGVLMTVASVLGRGEQARRLLDSLQVDITPTLKATGWRPSVSLEEGLRRTAHLFLQAQSHRR